MSSFSTEALHYESNCIRLETKKGLSGVAQEHPLPSICLQINVRTVLHDEILQIDLQSGESCCCMVISIFEGRICGRRPDTGRRAEAREES